LVLILGLVLGLIFGLVLILVSVLFPGLGFSKNAVILILIIFVLLIGIYGLATDKIYLQTLLIVIIPASIAISEIIFIQDKQKPTEKQNRFWFTAKVKAESYLDTFFGLCILATAKLGMDQINLNWQTVVNAILTYGIYPLMFFGVVGFVGIYIWLNSFKYRQKKDGVQVANLSTDAEGN
jgi:hypothetical protein